MDDIIQAILDVAKDDENIEENSKYYIRAITNLLIIEWSNDSLNRHYSSYENAYGRASVLFYNAMRDD
jgi:hypothetical protein